MMHKRAVVVALFSLALAAACQGNVVEEVFKPEAGEWQDEETVVEDSQALIASTVTSLTASTTGGQTTVRFTLNTSTAVTVERLNVAIRDAAKANWDITIGAPVSLSGIQTFTGSRALPPGTYTYRVAYKLSGSWSNLAPTNTMTVGATCTPTSCAAQGKNYGALADGCGGTLSCGTCTSPNTCGGGGTANVCGTGSTGLDPVIAAAGDIANSGSADAATANLLLSLVNTARVSQILTLGDNAYSDGTLSQYRDYYAPTWGQSPLLAITRPVPGNHEYHTSGAAGYFDYFNGVGVTTGRAGTRGKGYYAYDVGAWRLYALNSGDCSAVPCSSSSEQYKWLAADLATATNKCVLAYWHHPRFQSGTKHGDSSRMADVWDLLYDRKADLVLVGHEHGYQQFGPMNKAGALDPVNGVRSFVVGTGGASFYTGISTSAHNSLEFYNTSTHGVLQLTLHESSYDWKFIGTSGAVLRSGTAVCH